jgi:Spy/CpxP family protein refolding chaperone
MKPTVAGVMVGVLVAATAGLAGQQRAGQRTPPRDQPREAQRGGPQPQRSKWWQDDRIKAELRLTPDQSARIEDIFQASLKNSKETIDELHKREEQLSNLISGSNDVTEAQVLKQAELVEMGRSTLSKARTLMLFRMYRVLSPEQRMKLQALREHDRQQRPGPPV